MAQCGRVCGRYLDHRPVRFASGQNQTERVAAKLSYGGIYQLRLGRASAS